MGTLRSVARLGDTGEGTCYLHPEPTQYITTFVSNPDTTVTADGIIVCTIGAIGQATCGHMTIAVSGSGESIDPNGNAFHRVLDIGHVVGSTKSTYVVVTGSPYVSSE
jgi:hypothetical protein